MCGPRDIAVGSPQGWTPRPAGNPPRGEGGVPRPVPHCGEGGVPCPAPPHRFLVKPFHVPPRPVKKIASPSIPGSPTTTTAGGEATGQDKSSAAGIFVPTVEHVHGGGGVLVFVVVLALALALIWCCARRRLSWGCMADRVGGFLLRKVFDIRCACSQVVLIASLVSEHILFTL